MRETGAGAVGAYARLIEDNLVLTCEAARLYRDGGFPGEPALLDRLSRRVSGKTQALAEVFPGFPERRPAPPHLFGGAAAFRDKQAAALSAPRPPGPPTWLCVSRDIRLSGNALFHVEDGRPQVLFETFRPQERHVVPGPGPGFLQVDETVAGEGLVFLLNSAGSFNYGHWLIDDLPRLRAVPLLQRLHPREPVTVALVSYFPHIDEARRRSIRLLLGPGVAIRFLDRDKTYLFPRLHHATPCSLPSTAKSPEALRFLAGRVRARTRLPRLLSSLRALGRGRAGRRLFVDRHPGRGRALVNREAVLAVLNGLGFEAFDPELADMRQQAVRFAGAEAVVGLAGAGMANTVFCAPGTPILHLVPEGWEDPFYAELAMACGQEYRAVFGPRTASDWPEHLHDFSIEAAELRAALAATGIR